MLLTMFLFVSLDSLAKVMSASFPPLQLVWARYFFHALLVAVLIVPRGNVFRTKHLGLQVARSTMIFAATFFYFSGLKFLPLAEATAILTLGPLLTVALAVPILGEQASLQRWVGVGCGLVGALIVIRPGLGVLHWAAIFPVMAAVCYGGYQVLTRYLAPHDQPLTSLAYSAVGGAIVASLVAPFDWVWPEPVDWLALVSLGVVGALGQYAVVRAWSAAPARVLAPFNYTNLIWAVIFGYLLFDQLPDVWTGVGAAIIVASGLYVMHRERMTSREHVHRSPTDGERFATDD
ncbi:MAG: DMT family transporter [Alphaproteobacteria bacterium]|nr:MAG: DMT family transporter [Alphaproteobacteria bacterium]